MSHHRGGTVRLRERGSVLGSLSAKQVIELSDGHQIDLAQQGSDDFSDRSHERAQALGVSLVPGLQKRNLVVSTGRDTLARQLAGDGSRKFISRIQLGDTKVSGVVSKDTYPPDLSDNALVNEIRTLLGAPGATFELDGYTFPSVVTKVAPAGLPGTLAGGPVSTLTDLTADFITAGVNDKDKVTVFIGGEDYSLGVLSVISATQLEVENPSQLAAAGISYNVTTPGGQVLFSKFVSGNSFPEAQFGPITVVHEAGLLYNDGSLFNRIIFVPGDPDVGLVFQPQDIDGISLGVQFNWLISFE